MKIPKHIRQKMHKIAEFSHKSGELSSEVDAWFEAHGYDIAELRCGDGCSLEELNYGNDVVYVFCERIENGDFCSYGERKKVSLEDIVDIDAQTKANNEAMRKVIDFIAGERKDDT